MAATMWFGSLIPWTDANGDPYTGAEVYFYNEGTTTPQTVYTDAALSNVAGLTERTANASGRFRALFLSPGSYRCKVLDADGVTIEDVDGIAVAEASNTAPPETGSTDTQFLFQTGDVKQRYGTGTHTGWVRMNGRTIGSATSGATERANADCQALFLFLWAGDSSLAVSGGRGASAAADWAANKNIALPTARGRVLVGLDDMGSATAGVITGLTTLGATGGAQSTTLAAANIPQLTGTTSADGQHGHPTYVSTEDNGIQKTSGGFMLRSLNSATYSANTDTAPSATPGKQIGAAGSHSHTITLGTASPTAISQLQPYLALTLYMKL
jgi:microcystin-dependent protein